MALNTTPGSPSADSYISLADYKEHCTAMGWTYPSGAGADDRIEQGIRRGTRWLDNTYRARFPGRPTDTAQALEWPRSGVYWRNVLLPDDVIPSQVVEATAEAARREIDKPGSLSPDLKRGGAIKSVGAGSARVEYMTNAPGGTVFQAIDGILSGLLASTTSLYSGRAVRA